MLGKMMGKGATSGQAAAAQEAASQLNVLDAQKIDSSALPRAPVSAFRKRPVKLAYDKNEYWMFRLPSEQAFLLGSFDTADIFGKRKGITHSPHIKAQTDLDTNLLYLIGGVTLLMLATEIRRHAEFHPLRENFRNSNEGKFQASDFKEKL